MISRPSRLRFLSEVRLKASKLLNKQLNRFGYALIRLKGERSETMFSEHLGVRYAYENILITDTFSPWAIERNFLSIWEQVHDHTLVDIYRAYELYDLVRQTADVNGDILEVGVWRGGSGAILAGAAARWKPNSRVWLCDTFSGVVKAGMHDPTYKGGEHSDTSRQAVVGLTSSLGLSNIDVLQGSFPDETGSALEGRQIAFCHIDVDVYQSGADIMEWLLPRVSRGSVIVFDDYGFSTCAGVTQLVNELRAGADWHFIYNLNKHAILIRK